MFQEYEFRFDAYTPETIPFERLVKYLVALNKVFGTNDGIHFNRIEEGSTRPIFRVDSNLSEKFDARFSQIGLGTAANDAMSGFDELNSLLRDDNAVGTLTKRSGEARQVVLRFQGRDLPKPVKYGPFTELTEICGELIRIGGKDKSAHAQIIDAEGKTWSVTLSRDVATRMANYLYKGPILLVRGDGKWERDEKGAWVLLDFKGHDFELLKDEVLTEVAARMRNFQPSEWTAMTDIDAYISASRSDDAGEVH